MGDDYDQITKHYVIFTMIFGAIIYRKVHVKYYHGTETPVYRSVFQISKQKKAVYYHFQKEPEAKPRKFIAKQCFSSCFQTFVLTLTQLTVPFRS